MATQTPPLDGTALRAAFDAVEPLTVGIEEELMLLDPVTHDLAPVAGEVLARVDGDPRFKREFPAAQLELVTPPARSVADLAVQLAAARRDAAAATDGIALLAGAGVHPFAAPEGVLSGGRRYAAMEREYGPIARRQLVFALQIHVAVGGADRTLAVYNALRAHLPELAALAANAPFYDGRDTGMASFRPTLADMLPRQGMPPPIASWDAWAEDLRWGARTGRLPEPGQWWFELRPHPHFGTLELRVPDTQATVAEAAAVAAVAHALVAQLAERADSGDWAPSWRIEENRWAAARHGVEGEFADLRRGEMVPIRERLLALIDELEPYAERLGGGPHLAVARELAARNGAMRTREAAPGDARAATAWLAGRFLEGC
ncbi:MAG: glutamate---cysteine ligase / carboxylate-amine ligase [Solirubrobacteraceae bacterium]|jgi:carboxylate-amine ligase|nr:glutamate---cysteine ligase / carboxylate-amine ligase [Solirubrobacteraceae bacterium]